MLLQGLGCAIGVEGIVTKAIKFLISEAVFDRHSAPRKRLGSGAEMDIGFIDIDCFEHTYFLFRIPLWRFGKLHAAVDAGSHRRRCLGKLIWPCQNDRP
jgi:hypothetical protein